MNPGSDEARAAGCVCAVVDNGRGRYPYMGWNADGTGNWSVRGDCPLHGFDVPNPQVSDASTPDNVEPST